MSKTISQSASNSLLQISWFYSRISEACVVILLLELSISSILHLTPPKLKVCGSYGPNRKVGCIADLTCCSACSCTGSHLKLAAFCVTWYMDQSSISRCGMYCLQNPKKRTGHCAFFFVVVVGNANSSNLSFTLEGISQKSPNHKNPEAIILQQRC